jgi:hypothetical protein
MIFSASSRHYYAAASFDILFAADIAFIHADFHHFNIAAAIFAFHLRRCRLRCFHATLFALFDDIIFFFIIFAIIFAITASQLHYCFAFRRLRHYAIFTPDIF